MKRWSARFLCRADERGMMKAQTSQDVRIWLTDRAMIDTTYHDQHWRCYSGASLAALICESLSPDDLHRLFGYSFERLTRKFQEAYALSLDRPHRPAGRGKRPVLRYLALYDEDMTRVDVDSLVRRIVEEVTPDEMAHWISKYHLNRLLTIVGGGRCPEENTMASILQNRRRERDNSPS